MCVCVCVCVCVSCVVWSAERLWEGYYLGAFGDYFLNDVLLADFRRCASSKGLKGCISLARHDLIELGIGSEPTAVDTDEDDTSEEGSARSRRALLDVDGQEELQSQTTLSAELPGGGARENTQRQSAL